MKGFLKNTWKNRAHVVLALPAFLLMLFMNYIPMSGLVMAFKKFNYSDGLFKSPWVGLSNFQVLLTSKATTVTITTNTVKYYFIFTILGTLLNVILAIAIDQCVFKGSAKIMQTIMIIPVFISYAAVQFILYAFISTDMGIINRVFLPFFGIDKEVKFYTSKEMWPTILTVCKMWKDVGYGSVLYMSVLAGIDQELYEAAKIDGANKWQSIWNITIPMLIPMITVMLLLSTGNIFRSDTGLFYILTRNSGLLYETTQTIDAYVLNSILTMPNFGFTSAITMFQSVVGLLFMLISNFSVRKLSPENSLF